MIPEAASSTLKPRILIAADVIGLIEHEALLSAGNETGGILVGRRLDDTTILVLGATKPGPNSDRRVHTFAPDVQYANQQLEEFRRLYPGADFVGIWHKHPPELDHPSDGDWKQAIEMLGDPDYAVDELVAPIIIVQSNAVTMKVYYLHRRTQRGGFIPVDYTQIPDSESQRLLQQSLQSDVRRYTDRLSEELQRLQSYDVGKPHWLEDGSMVFTVHQPEETIYLLCSTLYPQAAPRLMVERQDGQQHEVASTVITNWTSERYLVEVVEEVVSQLRQGPPPSQNDPPMEGILRRTPPPEPPEPPKSSRRNLLILLGGSMVFILFLCVLGLLFLRLIMFPVQKTAEAGPATSTVASLFVSPTVFSATNSIVATPVSTLSTPTSTPRSTITPISTSTATPIPTSTATPISASTLMGVVITPLNVDSFSVVDPLRAYSANNAALPQSFQVGRNNCFTMRFSVQNTADRPIYVHWAGVAVSREGKNLDQMFFTGITDKDHSVISPDESFIVNVQEGGTICGVDLFTSDGVKKEAVQYHNILLTDILTLVPSIRASWLDVDCATAPDHCPWFSEIANGGSLIVQYQP